MIPFIEYLEENFAPEIRPVIAGAGTKIPKQNVLKDVVDIVWISEKKLKQIAQHLKSKHSISATLDKSVEGEDVLSIKMPHALGAKSFQLFPDNVLVIYPENFMVLDIHHEPHRSLVHQLNTAYKEFPYQKKV